MSSKGGLDDVVAVLADDVIDRIAAGEVIERPASVVKELVENALDAEARHVEVWLEEGGLRRVMVADDGVGMSPRDAERCLLRHATSKLRRAEDLEALTSYGFRGEALSSIAAIARLTLTTRRACDDAGVRLDVEAGRIVGRAEVGCAVGTSVDVRDLFFNTPARRKFMRAPATEQSHALEAACRTFLGGRRAGGVVFSGGRRLLDVPGDGTPAQRIAAVLREQQGQLRHWTHEHNGARVELWLAPGERARDGKGLWFFVNGRFVRDRMLQRAVLDAFQAGAGAMPVPAGVAFLDVTSAAVDVNVHPQKLEVRFGDANAVYRLLHGLATRAALEQGEGERRDGRPPGFGYAASRLAVSGVAEARAQGQAWSALGARGAGPSLDASPTLGWRPVGRVLQTYAVFERADEVAVVDLRAVAQRAARDAIEGERARGEVSRRALVLPEVLEVSAMDDALLRQAAPVLARYGVDIDAVGARRYLLRSVPEAMVRPVSPEFVDELLRALRATELTDAHVGELVANVCVGELDLVPSNDGAHAGTVVPDVDAALRLGMARRWSRREWAALVAKGA